MLALAPAIQSTTPTADRAVGAAVGRSSRPSSTVVFAPLSRPTPRRAATVAVYSQQSSISTPIARSKPPSPSIIPPVRNDNQPGPSTLPVDNPQPHPSPAVETSKTRLSFDIHNYPTTDLIRILASVIQQIATANDALPSPASREPGHPETLAKLTTASRLALSTPSSPLTFHARNVPTISLEAYLLRILKYCPTTNEVFLSLLVYFDRMSKLSKESTGRTFVIDSYNVHRLVIAGVTVASKFFSDVFYTNSRYAKVGGLPQGELNQLELQFLLLNDFRLTISPDELQRYADQLLVYSASSGMIDPVALRPPSPPSYQEGAGNQPARRDSPPPSSSHAPPRTEADGVETDGTETDAESVTTDDEPTIRPTHSCASSETSLATYYSSESDRRSLGPRSP